MRSIQIILLGLIFIGIGLIATKNLWLPPLADAVVEREGAKIWIDQYFSKDPSHVYYASFQGGKEGVITVTTKALEGADPDTFRRVSDMTVSTTTASYREWALYSDKNSTYTYLIFKTAGGVQTLVTATSSSAR